jgi:DNA-binding NarL/FixJ family response regulator
VLACVEVSAKVDNPLSAREREVLTHIAEGKSNRQIAETLNISVSTVKAHVQEILLKLAATDRTQAAVKALRQGLL